MIIIIPTEAVNIIGIANFHFKESFLMLIIVKYYSFLVI